MVLLAIIAFTSCKQVTSSVDLKITPVNSLISPADNKNIQIDPQNGQSVVFKWDAATTPDSGLVLYDVVFDKAGGDFSEPVYKQVSDGSGVQTQATITQKQLNKIASMAGIQASSSGTLKWAVIASKVANDKLSTVSRTLKVERPAGFTDLPNSLYITGSATEAGNDITKAIQLKKTSDGVFEVFTSLQAGSYQLTDQPNSNGTKYYVDSNDIIKKGNSSTTVSGSATKAYRLKYDFNDASAKTTEIDSVGLFMSAYNKDVGELTYAGNSTWEVDSLAITFVQFSWGKDDRYKFILHTPNGDEYWGSQNANNVQPAGQPPSYFYLVPVTNAQWDNTYKFDPSADGNKVNVHVYFQSSGPYTHKVTYLK